MNQTFTIEPVIYHRAGQPYEAVLQSGMESFGAQSSNKRLTLYTPILSSDSPDYPIAVALRDAVNPADAADVITDIIESPQVHNLIPVIMQGYMLGDRISASGTNHLVKLSQRTFTVLGINDQGFERK